LVNAGDSSSSASARPTGAQRATSSAAARASRASPQSTQRSTCAAPLLVGRAGRAWLRWCAARPTLSLAGPHHSACFSVTVCYCLPLLLCLGPCAASGPVTPGSRRPHAALTSTSAQRLWASSPGLMPGLRRQGTRFEWGGHLGQRAGVRGEAAAEAPDQRPLLRAQRTARTAQPMSDSRCPIQGQLGDGRPPKSLALVLQRAHTRKQAIQKTTHYTHKPGGILPEPHGMQPHARMQRCGEARLHEWDAEDRPHSACPPQGARCHRRRAAAARTGWAAP